MKYTETDFRSIAGRFFAFPLTETLEKVIAEYPDAAKADSVLTYGYIDHEAGLSLEVLAAGKKTASGFRFFDTNLSVRAMIRIGAVENEEFEWLPDKRHTLQKRYAERLEVLKAFEVSEEVEKTRKMAFLDASRDRHYPDDVLVFLMREGLQPEGCWTRMIGLGDHCIVGMLLNEPNQNFGYHKGDNIAFFVDQNDKGEVICFSDMNPSQKLTEEDLADGSMLKEAVSMFNQLRTEDNFITVLELLRDSVVWIPCDVIFSNEDQAQLDEMVGQNADDLSGIVGKAFTAQNAVRLKPCLLRSGDKQFFPVFSGDGEMGEQSAGMSKVQDHMLKAIQLAAGNENDVAGIVLNPFTEPFVLDRELFDLVAKMKSRIVSEN